MNKLSYGLLSLLTTRDATGYELMRGINKFWRSTHSAIYPILSNLEEKGYVIGSLVKQESKPDKKIYTLTKDGMEILHKWFVSETSETVIREEAALKLYCMHIMDSNEALKLINEIEEKYIKKLEKYSGYLNESSKNFHNNLEEINGLSFGAYILTQREINKALLEIQWCKWVRKFYNDRSCKFEKIDFFEFENN